jgi:GNAT superfamily N-acetyltransferase
MTISSTPATLPSLRDSARDLLNEFDAADGLASYYALHHDPKRTTLFVHRDADQVVDGFLVRCMTGFDLFRPLITLRLRGEAALPALLEEALMPGRPYWAVIPAPLADRAGAYLRLDQPVRNRIYRMDPRRFRPEMNALVVTSSDPHGAPRAEIKSGGQTAAIAGVNWRSPIFAEVYVNVTPEHRKRGWGRAVTNAVVGALLKQQVTPLYSAAEDNTASQALAESVGFTDTGAREVMAQAVYET